MVRIQVSPECGEIKRMHMQLIPGSPFPSPREPEYEASTCVDGPCSDAKGSA